jgi:hypothetical protein
MSKEKNQAGDTAPAQLILPYKIIKPEQVVTITQARQDLNRAQDTYWVPLKKIKEREGFNPRFVYEGIEDLAEKISVNGLSPMTVDMLADGKIFVEKGHRRLRALRILSDKGILQKLDLPGVREGKVLCFLNTKEVSELDRIKNALSDNDSVPLNPVEQADCIWRMKHLFNMGLDEIKAATGLSRQHIDNRLLLADQSPFVKDCIAKGIVKATTVTKLARQVASKDKVSDLIEGMTKSKKTIRGTDVDELARKEKKEEDKPETFDEAREEIALCQNVIRTVDKIGSKIKKVENPQLVGDIEGLINFIQADMVKIREYVKKHKR